jgi:hypothetical protein
MEVMIRPTKKTRTRGIGEFEIKIFVPKLSARSNGQIPYGVGVPE